MEDKQKSVARGKRAQQFATDPVVVEVLAELEQKYTSDWKTSKPEDQAKRDRAYAALQLLEDFKVQITILIADGRLAARQIEKDAAV